MSETELEQVRRLSDQRASALENAWETISKLNQDLDKLKELNSDKFNTIQAYCEAASHDKWVIATLRKALVGLVGSDNKAELEAMEAAMRMLPIPDEDRMKTINAIHALRDTL